MFLRTARRSNEAIIALALDSVILIVRDADFFVTTRRAVRLTGTLCEIIFDILVLPQLIDVIIMFQENWSSGIF